VAKVAGTVKGAGLFFRKVNNNEKKRKSDGVTAGDDENDFPVSSGHVLKRVSV